MKRKKWLLGLGVMGLGLMVGQGAKAQWNGGIRVAEPQVGQINVVEPGSGEKSLRLKNLTEEQGKAYLMQVIGQMDAYLNKVETKVIAEAGLDRESQQEIKREIQMETSWLDDEKDKVNQNKKKDELRKMVDELDNHWEWIKVKTQAMLLKIKLKQLDEYISRLNRMNQEITSLMEIYRDEGKNVIVLGGLEDDVKLKLKVAEDKKEAAEVRLEEAVVNKKDKRAVGDGLTYLRESRQYAVYASQVLVKLAQKLEAVSE